jgi:hypothetical protein
MKKFDIITEADARTIDVGATVELTRGGHVTPLARDTLTARRITVIPAGSADPALPADLAPVADVRRITIGNDHTGVALKHALVRHLRGKGLAVQDAGTNTTDAIDYPDVAAAVANAVARGEADAGDCGEQSARDPRRHRGRRDDRALFPRAQRGQRPDPRIDDPDGTGCRHPDRRDLARHPHARGALYPSPAEDP